MRKDYIEITIGVAIIVFSVLFVLFAMKITNKRINQDYYHLSAIFNNIEGINVGTKVKIGGIEVGEVNHLIIDDNYKIIIKMKIRKNIKIPTDSNIKVATSGLIGGKYLRIEAGGEEEYLKNNDSFEFTESTMDLEDMITRFMLNSASKKDEKK